MKYVTIFFVIFFTIFNPLLAQEDYFIFQFFRYPKVIEIRENFKIKELDYKIECYFKNTYITTVCKGSSGSIHYYISGDILYLDKNGKTLPKAALLMKKVKDTFEFNGDKNIIECHFSGMSGPDDGLIVPFAKDAIYSVDINLFFPIIFEKTEIGSEIKKKNLGKIKVKVDKIYIDWSELKKGSVIQGWKKKIFTIDVSREVEIKIKYGKDNPK